VYPALAVLDRLRARLREGDLLWVGGEGGMEAELVKKAGVSFTAIPAAGFHGVGLRALPGNLVQVARGVSASRKVLREFRPDVMFFTGGYVAVPMALAGWRVPTLLYVPDIEPGMALRFLTHFADRIAVTAEDSRTFFSAKHKLVVSGYPTRTQFGTWERAHAYAAFGLSPDLPTLLVTGGSLGSLSINNALVAVLPQLLPEMQIIHLTGQKTWPQFEKVKAQLSRDMAPRYQGYPYLHERMGAALTIADLVLARAGASSLGEYPLFGLPAILVPYPYAWRYQKVNADYLVRHGAAIRVDDADLPATIAPLLLDLMRDGQRRARMKDAIKSLARPDAAETIAGALQDLAASQTGEGSES
jgi:undecaprenyldiphospho-muramoylpentapeptide beta-N-acetylglucosaminyltransferase